MSDRAEMLKAVADHNADAIEQGESRVYWAVLIEVGLATESYFTDVVLTGDAGRMTKTQDLPVRLVRATDQEVEQFGKAVESQSVQANL